MQPEILTGAEIVRDAETGRDYLLAALADGRLLAFAFELAARHCHSFATAAAA